MRDRSLPIAITLFCLLTAGSAVHAQDLPGLLDGIGSAASDIIGDDGLGGLGGGDLLNIEVLDGVSDGLLGDGGTDLLLLGAPSDDSPLQSVNVDLLGEDSLSSDLDDFNAEFQDNDLTLKVNSTGQQRCDDADRDTVCDNRDQCPDTPPGQLVLPDGCSIDLQINSTVPEYSSGSVPGQPGNANHVANLTLIFDP